MDAFELRGREHVGAALVGLDLHIDAFTFLQQPDDALGAGLLEPVIRECRELGRLSLMETLVCATRIAERTSEE
jgi:hypothetical protein